MTQRDYLDRLSAPDVGVGLTRWTFDGTTFMGHASAVMGEDPDGKWVLHEDVAPLLAAARTVPADVVLETTAEERAAVPTWKTINGDSPFMARLLRDHDTLAAALAASTAREKAKDEEIEGLREELVWHPIDDDAKDGGKVELIIRDIYDPKRVTVTIGYWSDMDGRYDARWWGDGISSHWQPVLYRRITVEQIDAALSGRKPDTKEGT